jgi:nucleotide-binding universal stress UspA family protein
MPNQNVPTQNLHQEKPTIVVCLDTSSNSNIVFLYACQIAKKSNFGVKILAVMDIPTKGLLFASKMMEKDKKLQIERKLKNIIEISTKETGIIPTTSIREGDVVREISAEIKSIPNAIMLILGKTYNRQSDNNVLPKLSAQIGNKIKVPVLIVPENLDEKNLLTLIRCTNS